MADNVPYNFVIPTAYGPMIVNRNDINQTAAFVKTGRSPDHEEIELLSKTLQIFNRNRVFFDVGANFGAYSLALAGQVGPRGKIYAFEAQRIIFNMLCGSLALNAIENVYAYNVAVSNSVASIEIPQYDYAKPLNFGSIEFGSVQRQPLEQERGRDPSRAEFVASITLDSMSSISPIDIIKIDVEGMEFEVLEGAEKTIAREQPFLYIEFYKIDRSKLEKYLLDRGYSFILVGTINYFCIPKRFKEFDGPWKAVGTMIG